MPIHFKFTSVVVIPEYLKLCIQKKLYFSSAMVLYRPCTLILFLSMMPSAYFPVPDFFTD